MSTLDLTKAELRKAVFARRKGAHAAGAQAAALAARDHVLADDALKGATVVAGYRPIRTEIDPTPLMQALHAAGRTLGVPVIRAPGAPLDFRAWTPESRMVPGPFGAEIPEDGDWVEPDGLLVPLVGFDAQGQRLGYGGGFYDRTLARLRGRGRVVAIGFAYAVQEVDRVPIEDTDQPLDLIATETGVRRPQDAC